MEPIIFNLDTPESKLHAMTMLAQLPVGERISITIEKAAKRRTTTQNAAAHKWFRDIAMALNDAGYSVNDRHVIKMDVPFTEEIVKSHMFSKIIDSMFDEPKTSRLTKSQMSEAVEVMNRLLADNWNIYVPFPSEEK